MQNAIHHGCTDPPIRYLCRYACQRAGLILKPLSANDLGKARIHRPSAFVPTVAA